MTKLQKTLLVCSSVCLALTIVSLFLSPSWVVIVLIALHSIALLYFCYLNYNAGPAVRAKEDAAQAAEKYRQLAREHEKLSQQLEQANLLCAELEQECQALRTEDAAPDTAADELPPAPEEDTAAPKPAVPYADMLPPAEDTGRTEPIDIIQVVADTIGEFRPFAEKAGIQLQISSALDTLPVKADHARIRILFRNIIDNSIKYMNRSGSLVVTISTIADDIFIVLKDNGDGLSESETPHIFEMNYQGSNRISGNGLGLTQAKAIVDYYGGTIYARSKPGRGMGIYIQIPME